MRILIIGAGAREHALARACASAREQHDLWCAPGNPGMALLGTCVDIAAIDAESLADLAVGAQIDLAIVGPEAALATGVSDTLRACGIATVGPGIDGALLETSKTYARELCARAGIPTPAWATLTNRRAAHVFVDRGNQPVVVKRDGLAGGKGVTVADTPAEAHAAIDDAFDRGDSSIVIEERLSGPEISCLALVSDGVVRMLPPARDHKRAWDGGTGPNTGGMGAIAPVPGIDAALLEELGDMFITPVVRELADSGIDYRGVLYAGIMLTEAGPRLIEYNARFGDPETQVVLPLVATDIVDLLAATANGTLDQMEVEVNEGRASACVVVAARGYPADPEVGHTVTIPEDAADCWVLHGATEFDGSSGLINIGGRVACAVAVSPRGDHARDAATDLARDIVFDGAWLRTDIGSAPAVAAARAREN